MSNILLHEILVLLFFFKHFVKEFLRKLITKCLCLKKEKLLFEISDVN